MSGETVHVRQTTNLHNMRARQPIYGYRLRGQSNINPSVKDADAWLLLPYYYLFY